MLSNYLKQKNLKVFEKGKTTRADLEQEFKKVKSDFSLEKFAVAASKAVASATVGSTK